MKQFSWHLKPSYKLKTFLYFIEKGKYGNQYKVSLYLTKCHAMKSVFGSGDIDPRIL